MVDGVVVVAVGASLPLLLVDAVSLQLGQVKEVLHGLQVHQKRLGGRARVLLLSKDLREQALQPGTRRCSRLHHNDYVSLIIPSFKNSNIKLTCVRLNATRANTAWETLALFSSFLTCW